MPRVNTVKKCQKDQGTCGGCGKAITKGMPYRWWKFRFGGKRKRCMDCRIRPGDLTQSKLGPIYDAQEDASSEVADWSDGADISELGAIAEGLAETVNEVAEEYREAVTAQEEHFPNGCPVMEENTERADELENWGSELESAASDLEEFDDDTVREEITDELRQAAEDNLKDGKELPDTWEPDDGELAEAVNEKHGEWADEQREKIESVVSECPV